MPSEKEDVMRDTVWIYPGSFDPLTYGHIDIIKRAAAMCGKLIVGVLSNTEKSPLFSIDERVNMINKAFDGTDNIEVKCFSGLQVDFYRQEHADAVVRGIRNAADYEYELTIGRTNQMLDPDFEIVLLLNDRRYSYVSSSSVRTLASYGGDISSFVPPFIADMIKEKYKERYNEQQD